MEKKYILFLILITWCIPLKSQNTDYYGNMLFMYQQPNARAEAMGGGHATFFGNPYSVVYNPGSSVFGNGLNVEFSKLQLNSSDMTESYYNTYGISYSSKKFGAFTFNLSFFNYAMDFNYFDAIPKTTKKYTPKQYNYTFNYSYGFPGEFGAGFNINYFNYLHYGDPTTGTTVDFGILKRLRIPSGNNKNNILLGLSLSNVLKTEVGTGDFKGELPQIFRAGLGYEYENEKKISGFDIFKMTYNFGYKNLLNLDNVYSLQFGAEFTMLEIILVRCGYYYDKLDTRRNTYAKDKIREFTYGFGINIPAAKLFNMSSPLIINMDITKLSAPNYYNYPSTIYSYIPIGYSYFIFSIGLSAEL